MPQKCYHPPSNFNKFIGAQKLPQQSNKLKVSLNQEFEDSNRNKRNRNAQIPNSSNSSNITRLDNQPSSKRSENTNNKKCLQRDSKSNKHSNNNFDSKCTLSVAHNIKTRRDFID
jgi:hypothetical protein